MRMTRKRHRQQERKRLRQATITNVLSHVKSLAAATAMLAVLTTGETYALPQDGTVVGGNATISQNGNSMAIQQMTDKLAINWQSFNIGANEKVAFYQPTSQSVALNRIVGNNASTIYGQLSANGKVYLINPNGILFAPGSEVNVGGLLASTKDISNSDFFQGNYSFGSGSATGSIVNQGALMAKDGGYVVLIGDQVTNSGTISANGGTVAMAAGGKVLLDAPGDGLINLVVSQPQVNAAVKNSGILQADGGKVVLTGQAGGDMLFSVINNSGMISAKSVQQKNGVIILDGGTNGTVEVSGTLDVSGRQGGTVKVLGDTVKLLSRAKVDASGINGGGEVLIGGNWQGSGTEAHAASVLVEKGASIQADALQNGDGGKVVLWSDKQTQFHGTITAKGGASSGRGGMVETSGKALLAADGSVNVSAASGKGGTWLLDPYNVIIQDTGSSISNGTNNPTANNSTVNVTSINEALKGGSNVTITTGNSGTQDGNITVAANIVKAASADSSVNDATLTLSAANNIILVAGKSIKSESGKLNVEFNADTNSAYGGVIQLQGGSSIYTNGGNITMYGQNDPTNGYARSITTALSGIQLLGTTLNAGGGNITLRGQNTANATGTASALGISVDGSGNSLLTSGTGKITLVGDAGTKGISITDSAAQISAGSGDIILTADRMALGGKLGKAGDTGTLTLQPLSSTTSIGVGGGAGILQLDDAVFSSVIQSSLSKVTIGRSDLSAAIDIGAVNFRNNMSFLATGTVPATGAAGEIKITGDVVAKDETSVGKTITLNSVSGTTTTNKITAKGLELLGSNASYSFTHTGNAIDTLAANAGTLVYTGGPLTVGTAGATNGLTLSGAGSVTTGTNDLTVSQNIAAGGNLVLAGKNVTVSSSAAIATTNDTISLTAGTGGMLSVNGSIDSNGGAITLTGPTAILNTNSDIASDGGSISVKGTGDVQLKGTGIRTGSGALTIDGSSITATGTNNIDGGSGMMTFTADTMNLPVGTLKVIGSGIVSVQSLSPSRMIDVGDGFNPDASHLQLGGQLFTPNGAFGSASFSMLNIGRSDSSSTLNVGNHLSFAAPTTLRTGDNGTISLNTFAAINNTTTNQALTFETGTLSSAEGATVTSGSGLLTLSANKLILSDNSSIATENGGSLLIKPKTVTNTVGLGTATGNLQITDSVFANVFRSGFSDITVQGSSIKAGALTSVKDNLTLQSTASTITLNGDLKVGGGKTITLEAKTSAAQTGGAIMTDGLQLLGSGAVYTLEQSTNQVGKLAAETGSVSYKGQNVTVDTVTNAAHNSVVGISATSNVTLESATGTTLTQNASISSNGGDITLTADTMTFNSGQLSGSGKLKLQPLDPFRTIDIGSFSVNSAHLQLGSNLFSGGAAGIQSGFESVTIGRDNGAGLITVAGSLSFANPTFIQSPTASGSIEFQADANLASARDLQLTAGTVTAAAGARITGNGDIYLTADAMSLGDGNTAGSTFASSGGTLYLRPLLHSTYIDLGSNLTPAANHLQFSNTMFNGDNKVFSGFGKYTIGGRVTDTVTVNGTAHFAGDLEIQSPKLHITDSGNLDPIGKVVLRNDAMIFDDGAKVTGNGDLTLTNYTAGHNIVIGTIPEDTEGALTIDGSTFTGMGRSGGAVFTGTYNGTLTFGDAAAARDITITNMNFDSLGQPSNAFKDVKNLQVLTQEAGTATINNSVLTVNKDITVQAGTIATGTGTTITSTSGDITLTSHTLELNSGENTIRGAGNLYLRPYNASDSIAVGDNSQTAKLNLSQTLFYNTAVGSNGALGNGFSHITIGREDGSGTVQIKNVAFQNDLTVLSPNGSIALIGNISDPGNITLNAADIKQTDGIVTATGLELQGGTAELAKANQVDVLAAKTNALTFRNGKTLTIGTVNGTTGVTTTGKTDIGSTTGLTVGEAVNSTGDILLSGTALVLNNNIATSSGDITLTGDTMTVDNDVTVSGSRQLKLQTLDASKNIDFGGSADSSLELAPEWFSGTSRIFQDGFTMITIGRNNGTGTVTVDNNVSFSDAVTLQSPGGSVVMNGTVNTADAITLKGKLIETKNGSAINAGLGTVTLQGNTMDFAGGTVSGTGNLVIKPLDESTGITVGGMAANTLGLAAAAFNGGVIKNDFNKIIIGDQKQSGTITVKNFTVGTDLDLLASAASGKVTIEGTLNTTHKNLNIVADGDISTTATGTLTDIGVLDASSINGNIKFDRNNISTDASGMVHTTAFNTISQLGSLTAKQDISVFNNGALTLTEAINSGGDTTIFANGDMTLGNNASAKGKNVTLIAEGIGSQFFNNSQYKGKAVQSNGGRWLIYSYSPLATGSDSATNYYNGLTSSFRRYNVTYAGGFNEASGNGFLYEYQPILTVASASRTYGNGNSTIVLSYDGLLQGDTLADLGLTGIANITFDDGQTITEASAAGTMYNDANPYKLFFHEDNSTNGTPNSLISLQGYKIQSTADGSYVPLTINQRTIIITPNDAAAKVYDAQNGVVSNSAYQLSGDGLAEYNAGIGETSWKDTLAVNLGGEYTQNKNVGTYQIAVDSANITSSNSGNNYLIINKTGKGEITPAQLTVAVGDSTKSYGDVNPAIQTTISGFAGNDTSDVVSGLKVTHAAGQYSNVGDYAITAKDASAQNYTFVYENGKLTIIPREITVTVTAGQGKVYGENNPTNYKYTATNIVNNDELNLTRDSGENVGQYAIKLGDNSNYKVTIFNPANFEITKRPLTITANNASRYYGYADPTFGFTAQAGSVGSGKGLVNGDKVGSVSFSNALTQYSPAGTTGNIEIDNAVFSSGTIGNYAITYNPGTLTINKAPLTITANNASRIYGDSNPSFTASYSGFKNGDMQDVVSGLQLATLAGVTSNVGSYDITASSGQAQNYVITYVKGNLTISPRHIDVISNPNQTKVYGQNNPTYTYTTTNMVNNDALSGTLGRIPGENAGTYDFTLGSLNNSNYIIDSLSGPGFVITPATLTVRADYAEKVYGTNDPAALTYQATGFVNNASLGINDSAALLTGNLNRSSGENVGSYSINQNTLSAGSNYAIEYTGNKLAITPAKLVIKANTGSKTYGDEDPALTYQATGLVNNAALGIDDSAGLSGQLSRNAGENAGNYQINQGTVALATEQLKSNYDVSYESNLFTINKADLTITANNASRIYGDSNPAFTATYSGLKKGDSQNVVSGLQLATSAGNTSNVGSYDITAANGQAQNYNITYVNGKLVITPATLTYVADPRERTVGQDNPGFTGSVTGFKNQDSLSNSTTGVTVFNSPATKDSPTGLYAINGEGLTANYGNYVFEQAPGNATALNIKGLNPPGQGAVDDTHGYHPTPPTTPGGTVGGGSAVNIGFNGNGAVTVGLDNDNNDIGDLTPRKEGISLPVFTRDSSGVSPEGLYDVSYNQTRLTVLPSGQNVPPAPLISSSNTPYAPFDIKIGDSIVSFSVQEVNGVVLVTPLTDEAKQVLQKNDKNNNKLILANALLTAINELSVVPDQLLAVLLATE